LSPQARVLVVEDEALVAFALEDTLIDLGYDVVGPASNVEAALKLVGAEKIDAAILDVNVGGESIEPVAAALAAAGAPFVFATGYASASALPAAFQDRPALGKPYRPEALREALARLLPR